MVSYKGGKMESLLKHLFDLCEQSDVEDIIMNQLDKYDRVYIDTHISELIEDQDIYNYDKYYVVATTDNLRFSITSEERTIVWKIEYVTPTTTTVLCKYATDL
jgi:hypothetical protein